MTRRINVGQAPDVRPTLDGHEITGVPVRFYSRKVMGGGVCGLWIGGQPMYDVTVYDAEWRPLGIIAARGTATQGMYDALRRVLVAEEIHA
jgi:YD repeat-containing protein